MANPLPCTAEPLKTLSPTGIPTCLVKPHFRIVFPARLPLIPASRPVALSLSPPLPPLLLPQAARMPTALHRRIASLTHVPAAQLSLAPLLGYMPLVHTSLRHVPLVRVKQKPLEAQKDARGWHPGLQPRGAIWEVSLELAALSKAALDPAFLPTGCYGDAHACGGGGR